MFKKIILFAGAVLVSTFAFPSLAASVDVNTADAKTLAENLDGIGIAKAEAIVQYREEHGPFYSLSDLDEVYGIGPGLLQRNQKKISISHEKPAESPKKSK